MSLDSKYWDEDWAEDRFRPVQYTKEKEIIELRKENEEMRELIALVYPYLTPEPWMNNPDSYVLKFHNAARKFLKKDVDGPAKG